MKIEVAALLVVLTWNPNKIDNYIEFFKNVNKNIIYTAKKFLLILFINKIRF